MPDHEDGPDFYTLLLGSALGMSIMLGANNLLMMFLGIEMASVPSYALVGFLKGRRESSEAALKFVVYGGGSAGVMLYGLSLLGGLTGTLQFPQLAARLADIFTPAGGELEIAMKLLLAMACVMVMAGFAFKLSVVPFHFWAPDAFQGASAEVGGYLSVASKAAALVLLARFAVLLQAIPIPSLSETYVLWGVGLGVIGAVTATYGNLAAYVQTNVKRLLAYSTIAHAGYMLMSIAAVVVLQAARLDGEVLANMSASRALEGLLFYLAVYFFMNLGAFAVTAFVRNRLFSEEIDDFSGLGYEAPVLAVALALCLFSLVGLPPLGGFPAKLFIFAAVYDAGYVHPIMWGILAIGAINTVFSLFYYARLLKVMYLRPYPEHAPRIMIGPRSVEGTYALIVSLPLLVLGILPQVLSPAARYASTAMLESITRPAQTAFEDDTATRQVGLADIPRAE